MEEGEIEVPLDLPRHLHLLPPRDHISDISLPQHTPRDICGPDPGCQFRKDHFGVAPE